MKPVLPFLFVSFFFVVYKLDEVRRSASFVQKMSGVAASRTFQYLYWIDVPFCCWWCHACRYYTRLQLDLFTTANSAGAVAAAIQVRTTRPDRDVKRDGEKEKKKGNRIETRNNDKMAKEKEQ